MGNQSSVGLHRENDHSSDSPRISNPSKMQTFHYNSAIALLFAACVALCASQNQEVPPKEVCEADVDDCVSSNTAFKCAMMFKNLTDLPLKVLDIIPDLIAHTDDPDIEAELAEKEISFEAFEIDDVCPAPGVTGGQRLKQINSAKKRANARCYAFLSDYASSSLSSCDLGLVAAKDSKAETVGDVLCERAYAAYNFPSEPKFWFTALVEIGAYVSYCGTSWQEVSTGGKHLVLNEKLCCVRNRKSGQVKYRPCNGSKRTTEKCA